MRRLELLLLLLMGPLFRMPMELLFLLMSRLLLLLELLILMRRLQLLLLLLMADMFLTPMALLFLLMNLQLLLPVLHISTRRPQLLLLSHPNGAVVPVDTPALAAARAEHLAARRY